MPLREVLGVTALLLREFEPGDEQAFYSLNEAWISKFFKMEEKDFEVLRDPRKYVLDPGGRIYFACRDGERLGCCALIQRQDRFELAKMGVAEAARGQGLGRALLEYVIGEARGMGVRKLYLESNRILENAVHLYESVGFRHVRPEKPSPFARSDVYMEMEF